MHIIEPSKIAGKRGNVITLLPRSLTEHPAVFADVRCDNHGKITIYDHTERYCEKPERDNYYAHNIKGLEDGKLIFDSELLVTFRGCGWYAWTFHPRGVLICYPDRLDLAILC